jgi:hypothetical protein
MAKDDNEEWRNLRKQLRQAGWNLGDRAKTADGVRLQLWPAPHTGPAEGVQTWEVHGDNKVAALRGALQSIVGKSSQPAGPAR